MLYLIRNEFVQPSEATGQELESLPVRTTPKKSRNAMHRPFGMAVIDL